MTDMNPTDSTGSTDRTNPTTPADRTNPTTPTAGDVAAEFTDWMASPVRVAVPAVYVGVLVGALAWPGVPVVAWGVVAVGLALLLVYALTIDRNRPLRMDPSTAGSWSSTLDGFAILVPLFGARPVRHALVEFMGVPVPAAVGVVGVIAAAIVWAVFRRPRSDMAPPPLPLPADFPVGSTAPTDRILAVLHVGGATPGRRIVFADSLPGFTSLSDADVATALASLKADGAVRVRPHDSAITERGRRRELVQVAAEGASAA